MLDGVGGEIHGADVFAVDERALGERAVELRQELSQPGRLRHAVSDSPVPAQQRTSGEVPGRGPQCHRRTGEDASAQQGVTPGDHACGDRPAEQRRWGPAW